MLYIKCREELELALSKLGELVSPYDFWSNDGRLLSEVTARTRYFQQLPKVFFECRCVDQHHMIAPRTISTYLDVDENVSFGDNVVLRGEFKFEVLIYRHYCRSTFFYKKNYFLVKCKHNILSLVSTPFGNSEKGRVEFTASPDCLPSDFKLSDFLVKT